MTSAADTALAGPQAAAPGWEFDRGTAVTADPAQPGVHRAELDVAWRIGGGINGGVVLATAARALGAELGGSPFSITAHYLSASRPGPAVIRTEVHKRGRTLSTGTAVLLQTDPDDPDGRERERIRVLASYGDHAALPDDVRTTAAPPALPPLEDCVSTAEAPRTPHSELLDRTELRLDPACVGWALGEPSGRGEIQGWLRLADGREPDPLMLLFAADALPPTTFDLGLPGWTPTLELTVHVRALPAPGWLRVRHATRNLAGGLLEEDAEVWDSTDRLVAQSRQLAMVPRG